MRAPGIGSREGVLLVRPGSATHRAVALSRLPFLPTKEQLLQRNQLLERVASMHQQRQRAEAEHAVGTEGAVTWWQDERLVVGCVAVELLVCCTQQELLSRACSAPLSQRRARPPGGSATHAAERTTRAAEGTSVVMSAGWKRRKTCVHIRSGCPPCSSCNLWVPTLQDVMESKLALQGPFVFTIKPDRPMFLTRKQVSPTVIFIGIAIVLFVAVQWCTRYAGHIRALSALRRHAAWHTAAVHVPRSPGGCLSGGYSNVVNGFCGGAQVVNMPLQQFRDLYREYINAFAACMLELASDPESPVLPRLERLVRNFAKNTPCKNLFVLLFIPPECWWPPAALHCCEGHSACWCFGVVVIARRG